MQSFDVQGYCWWEGALLRKESKGAGKRWEGGTPAQSGQILVETFAKECFHNYSRKSFWDQGLRIHLMNIENTAFHT